MSLSEKKDSNRVNNFQTLYASTKTSQIRTHDDGQYCHINQQKWHYYLKDDSKSWEELGIDMSGSNFGSPPNPPSRRSPALLREHQWSDVQQGLVVHLTFDRKRLFSLFPNYRAFLQYEYQFPAKLRSFYETVFGQTPQKPHFDLDVDLNNDQDLLHSVPGRTVQEVVDELVQLVLEAIIAVFQDYRLQLDLTRDILLFTSHGSSKRSFHIVIDNYYHCNHREAAAFYHMVANRIPSLYRRWLDSKVYSSIQQFRLEGSQKIGSGRIKVLAEEWSLRDRLVRYQLSEQPTNDFHRRCLIFRASLLGQVKGATGLPSFLPRSAEPGPLVVVRPSSHQQLTSEEGLAALDLVAQKVGVSTTDHRFPYRLIRVEGNLVILKRVKRSHCRICDRVHENENPFLVVVGQEKRVYFYCRRNDEGARLYVGSLVGKDSLVPEDEDPQLSETQLLALPIFVPKVNEKGEIIQAEPDSSISVPRLSSPTEPYLPPFLPASPPLPSTSPPLPSTSPSLLPTSSSLLSSSLTSPSGQLKLGMVNPAVWTRNISFPSSSLSYSTSLSYSKQVVAPINHLQQLARRPRRRFTRPSRRSYQPPIHLAQVINFFN